MNFNTEHEKIKHRTKKIQTRLSSLESNNLKKLKISTSEISKEFSAYKDFLTQLDEAAGLYQIIANLFRTISRQITFLNHDVEITISFSFFSKKIRFKPIEDRVIEIRLFQNQVINVQAKSVDKPIIHLSSPSEGDTCFVIGTDDLAFEQKMELHFPFDTDFNDKIEKLSVWVVSGISVGNSATTEPIELAPFLARSPRLCKVSNKLNNIESYFPLRLNLGNKVSKGFEDQSNDFADIDDINKLISNFKTLGLDLSFYDIHIKQDQISLFGRNTNQPSRSRGVFAPLELPDNDFPVGIKLHFDSLRPFIKRTVEEESNPGLTVLSISTNDNAIFITVKKEFKRSKKFELVVGTVTVKATITIKSRIKIKLSTKNINEIWFHGEIDEILDIDVDTEPDIGEIAEKIVEFVAEIVNSVREIADVAKILFPPESPEIDKRILKINKATKLKTEIGEDYLAIFANLL